MNGFCKVLKFRVRENYNNARKIADEIIESLVNNTSFQGEEKQYLPTYISLVREDFMYASADRKDDEISDYIIRIYKVKGNRKSRLSITQNKRLREIIFK